ncbi:tRNA (adenosine(37)-N6)-threonylcarbamoyltransferase complex dimerization subunit type 1 TsaB [uncultured Cloacibacillus sp.]|uniref:tRNA (adenosine(37)-N6)-threonylcarbamoyltransferase complex dimerization subunit type 1 TsaB n=1 Tax=uncultured Cloacibacillus sp. TaxID=889794 RepID=UPI00320A1DAF
MAVLGINCAGRWTNVGVAEGGAILAETNREPARRQSELLPLITEETLASAGAALGDISLVALGTGPGYYTGIRAGIAYGAALARALGVKAVPLSSLELFVWDMRDEYELLAPVFRARASHCYAALYESRGGALNELIEPCFIRVSELAEKLAAYPSAAVVSPDLGQYPALAGCGCRLVPRESASGGACALMGSERAALAVSPETIRGTYLRAPDIGPASL